MLLLHERSRVASLCLRQTPGISLAIRGRIRFAGPTLKATTETGFLARQTSHSSRQSEPGADRKGYMGWQGCTMPWKGESYRKEMQIIIQSVPVTLFHASSLRNSLLPTPINVRTWRDYMVPREILLIIFLATGIINSPFFSSGSRAVRHFSLSARSLDERGSTHAKLLRCFACCFPRD